MQKINRDALIQKANELLTNGTVTRVLGWKKGEFSYDVTPAIFTSVEDMNANFVFDDFSGNIVSLSGTGSVGTTSKGFT